jgi:predicted RNA-binding Zn-ribbon protein involved in translation (DUF1610 family)
MVCPNCGKEIDYLICTATEHVTYLYNGEFERQDVVDTGEMEFECPECHAVVAKDTKEADRILGLVKAKGVMIGVML